jgi:hypothetical protein
MHDERSPADLTGGFGAGPTLLAAFGRADDATAALDELLDAGFLNVEQEAEGGRTVLVLDAGDRPDQARRILAAHGGIEFDRPS